MLNPLLHKSRMHKHYLYLSIHLNLLGIKESYERMVLMRHVSIIGVTFNQFYNLERVKMGHKAPI